MYIKFEWRNLSENFHLKTENFQLKQKVQNQVVRKGSRYMPDWLRIVSNGGLLILRASNFPVLLQRYELNFGFSLTFSQIKSSHSIVNV
jgi:hypothetical protein